MRLAYSPKRSAVLAPWLYEGVPSALSCDRKATVYREEYS